MQRAQSAIEFLSTYSFVFLILAVMLALLLLFASIPKSTIPFECSFYSGFNCVDTSYYNTSSGSQLIIVGTDREPGVINISAFSSYLNYYQSTNGYCVPKLLTAGQSFYCVANFTTGSTLGSTYTGTFQLVAKYCAGAPGSLSALNCTASAASITYGGSVQLQGGAYSSGFFINLPYPPYIYCVGGSQNKAYYAPISGGGIGSWTSTNSYTGGVSLQYAGCSIYGSYIYCVGSNSGSGSQAYYAKINSNGIMGWKLTTNAPVKVNNEGCSVYSGYIYCVGSDTGAENQAYYASLSSNGIGNWIATSTYPIQFQNAGCSIYRNYIYCVGGAASPSNQVYYAPVRNPGIGTWAATTSYPVQMAAAGCSVYEGYIYCIGSQSGSQNYVYYAPVSGGGVGNWIASTSYPLSFNNAGCSVFNGYLYCVGSASAPNNQVYYAPILNPGIGSWIASNPYPASIQDSYCSVPGSSGGYAGGGGAPS